MCHFHAERRDIDATGGFFVRLRTPREVKIVHIFLFSWMLSNMWPSRCVPAVPVAVGAAGLSKSCGVNEA